MLKSIGAAREQVEAGSPFKGATSEELTYPRAMPKRCWRRPTRGDDLSGQRLDFTWKDHALCYLVASVAVTVIVGLDRFVL